MKSIANKAFAQFEKNINKLNGISDQHKNQKDEIRSLFEKADRLKNHIIMLDEEYQQAAILTLSAEGNSLYNQLEKSCVYKIA